MNEVLQLGTYNNFIKHIRSLMTLIERGSYKGRDMPPVFPIHKVSGDFKLTIKTAGGGGGGVQTFSNSSDVIEDIYC